jgi:hypothetical protein
MTSVALLHQDARIRELYQTVLQARGHGVVTATVVDGVHDPAIRRCELIVAQAADGQQGLNRLRPLLVEPLGALVCLDDDPDPFRDRWFTAMGFVAVLHGPVSLRCLVDAVDAHVPDEPGRAQRGAVRSARLRRDSSQPERRSDFRGTVDRRGRHLLLASDDLEVALHCFPRQGSLRVRGRVVGASHPVLAEVVLSHPEATMETRTDAVGRFEFEPVTPGLSALEIRGRGWSLHANVELASA